MEQMKDIPKLGSTSAREGLAGKFHMSQQLLSTLNPGQRFAHAGDTIVVLDTSSGQPVPPVKADRVEVDKNQQTVKLFDKSNSLIGFYTAPVGSEEKPSPSGTLKVTEIDHNPIYRYNPEYPFKGVYSRKPFTIKPGPNNPVGTVWINLSADGYGIHGTPAPDKLSKAASHGCVRLTNWNAERVADSVVKGAPSRLRRHAAPKAGQASRELRRASCSRGGVKNPLSHQAISHEYAFTLRGIWQKRSEARRTSRELPFPRAW